MNDLIVQVAVPVFTQHMPAYAILQTLLHRELRRMMQDGLLTPQGKVKGCTGCKGSAIMKRYRPVYDHFVEMIKTFQRTGGEMELNQVRTLYGPKRVMVYDRPVKKWIAV